MNLPMLRQDHANHLLYGALIALAAGALFGPGIGLLLAVVGGALKEAVDLQLNRRATAAGLLAPHGVEYADFLCTACGGFIVYLASRLG